VRVLWRLTNRSFIDGWPENTPGNVKLLLPPRQSRGNSPCIRGMADYRLVLAGLAVFVVDIAPTSGRRSMRRFSTEAAALTWISEQEFLDVAAETAKGADVNQSSASLS